LVKDIYLGAGSSSPREFFSFQGQLYFQADDGTHGVELWKTDGTSGGTLLVADINPGPNSSNPSEFVNANNQLVFWADDGVHGRELWLTDGLSLPHLVKDIWPGSASSVNVVSISLDEIPRAVMNGVLYFTANDGTGQGFELWRSDGTADGTYLVERLGANTDGAEPQNLTVVNNTLFFTTGPETLGTSGLWRTDGTSNGTAVVASYFIRTGEFGGGGYYALPQSLRSVNGLLYFVFGDDFHGWELWRSDGTTDGTFLIQDIRSGVGSSDIGEMTEFDGLLYFVADDAIHGRELWRTDGTTNGTSLVEDLLPGPEPANPAYLTVINGTLYYFANDGGDDLSLRSLNTRNSVPCNCPLSVTFSSGQVTISWPCASNGCILEAAEELLDPASATVWIPISPQPAGGNYSTAISGTRRYFRLRAP
jgi:ELWxxDGT repeat protein